MLGKIVANEEILYKKLDIAKSLSKKLSTEKYHVSESSDVNDVEDCAAIKNIFSINIIS